jgi:AcrR family transcriptional regulator
MQKALVTPNTGIGRRRTLLSRRERSELIRDRIMSNAALIFFQKGYVATSLEDIAKASGVNKATIYYYFKAKSKLLYEICTRGMNSILDVAQPGASSDLPAEKKLQILVTSHIQLQIARKGFTGLGAVEVRDLPKRLRTQYVSMRDEYEALFRKVLKEGVEQGRFAPMNVRLGSLFLLGFLNSIIQWYNPKGELTAEEIVTQAFRFILSGLGAGELQAEYNPA